MADKSDATNDSASDCTVVEDGFPFSATVREKPKPPPATSTLQAFPDMVNAIEKGDEVLTAIDKAIDSLYDVHLTAARAEEPQEQMETQTLEQITPSDALLAQQETGHEAAYASGKDLVKTLRNFGIIFKHLPPNGLPETAAILADVVVQAFHQWTAIRIRLGEDATYARIIGMFNVYVHQCMNQAAASARALSCMFREQSEAVASSEVRDALHRCLGMVRGHESLRVSQVWAASLDALLPLYVRSCTVPYDKANVGYMVNAYAFYADNILIKRKPGAKVEMEMEKEKEMKMERERETRHASAWTTFVANRYKSKKSKKKNGLRGWLLSLC